MKIRCEYCQNMVDARAGTCPFCGSALPEAPERKQVQTTTHKTGISIIGTIVGILVLALGGGLISGLQPKDPASRSSVSDAMTEVNAGTAEGESYQTVITYYLESGETDSAYRSALELLKSEGGSEYGGWCVDQFLTFSRRDLAGRLAAACDAMTGTGEQLAKTADIPLDELLPDSPLCQALELVLSRTAGNITLEDLQDVRGLSIGALDRLTGALEIGVAFDEAGEDLVTVSVDSDGSYRSPGLICFQGLRCLTLASANVRTSEDLFLPDLRELNLLVRMDGEDLTGFTHLKKLERLQVGGSALVSLEGLDEMPALTALTLFDTGLSDLASLAAQEHITELALLDNGQLAGVASLSQATHLRKLSLSGKTFSDLSPLASLTGLTSLSIERTSIRDAAFLKGLAGLTELSLTSCRELEAVPELAGLSALERLTLDNGDLIASKEDLGGLTSLRTLDIKLGKQLSFLAPLSWLEDLTLRVNHSEVDLAPLRAFAGLKRFCVAGESFTQLYGLEVLRDLPLTELDLSGLSFYGPIDPVLEISTLERLSLADVSSEGTDYSKFANLTALRILNLDGFRDMIDRPPGPDETYWSYERGPASVFVDRLSLLPGLEELHLSECGVESAESLAALGNLRYLDLSGNSISSAAPLAGLAQLTYLNLSGNPIADLSPVEGRAGLTLIR